MFYIIDESTREVIRRSQTPFNIDESIKPPAGVVQLKHVVDETQPTFDPATHKLERTFTDDGVAGTRTFSFEAVPLTAGEAAAVQQLADDTAELDQIKTVYNAIRNGTGTAGASVEAQITGTLAAATQKTTRINALNSAASPFVTVAASGGILIKGIIVTGANAGNLVIQHLKVTSGTATVHINSFLKAVKIV